jgi:hypothetical protein
VSELARGDEVTFIAEGFAMPLRGRILELDEDWVVVQLLDGALDEEGVYREPGPNQHFRVARMLAVKAR